VITGHDSREYVAEAIRLGAAGYITKLLNATSQGQSSLECLIGIAAQFIQRNLGCLLNLESPGDSSALGYHHRQLILGPYLLDWCASYPSKHAASMPVKLDKERVTKAAYSGFMRQLVLCVRLDEFGR